MTERSVRALCAACIVVICACGRGPQNGTDARTEEEKFMKSSAELERCASERISEPWSVVEAHDAAGDSVVRLRASAADLGIKHRAIDARQQRYVEVSIARFRDYVVVNPDVLPTLLSSGAIQPADAVRGTPAEQLAPFAVYDMRDSASLLVNESAGEFCIDPGGPADWPNPFMRCQLVSGPYSAGFTFSAEAIAAVPDLFAQVRELLSRVRPCFDQSKDANNG